MRTTRPKKKNGVRLTANTPPATVAAVNGFVSRYTSEDSGLNTQPLQLEGMVVFSTAENPFFASLG